MVVYGYKSMGYVLIGDGTLDFNPNSEAGLSVAATPRRRKVPATPSSPVAAAIMPLPEKMRRGRRYHPVATRRHRYFRLAASVFGFNFKRDLKRAFLKFNPDGATEKMPG
jgi:hypothetical protein